MSNRGRGVAARRPNPDFRSGQHLDSEEKNCLQDGLKMTQEHVAEHRQLKIRLADIEMQLNNAEHGKQVFLCTFKDMLFYHITHFDKYLSSS